MPRFSGLSRREFLKLISLAPVGIYSRPLLKMAKTAKDSNAKNVIILVFDAWSQHNVSLYGYHRHTMPNLEVFAENATVFHNHYSTGTFTVPSTATILTGMHPWSHRAFQLGAGISSAHLMHTVFSVVSPTHGTLAFTQNKLADQILYQIEPALDQHVNTWRFNVQNGNIYSLPFFKKDIRMAYASLDDNIVQHGTGYDSSLFFGPLYRLHTLYTQLRVKEQYGEKYPLVMPQSPGFFLLNDVVDGAINLLKGIQQPTLTYIHFLPPHEPYAPTKDFFGAFSDGWYPPDKPIHDLSEKKTQPEKMHIQRQYYDEFIASWDHEVARLFRFLKDSGLTENSYIIVMADHGELFERGDLGHVTKLVYDPVIHVPLMILSPGQTQRQDVHGFTSSVDLLPTIAQLTANPIPDWVEGKLLPKFGGVEDDHRSIFSMDAKMNSSFTPMLDFSMSITRDHHRLTYYCYPNDKYQKYEFYDLDADPEEINDLYPSSPALAREMQNELLQKITDVNRPFEHSDL
jgi:arylsulfatase A-like enzyme